MSLIFRAYPGDDPLGTPLGVLTKASDKQIVVQRNGLGSGEFRINRHDDQAAWAATGNYIQVWLDEIAGDPVHAFWIGTGEDALVSADEQGGEVYRRGGQGPLAILGNGIVHPTAYATGSGAPNADGSWHWVDRKLGAIFKRLIDEAVARGVFGFDLVTLDFSAVLDSAGDPWDTVTGDFKLDIGQDLLAATGRLQAAGLWVKMDPDFTLHAWNDAPGTDLSGSITFTKGVDIREGVGRSVQASPVKSRMVVQGSLESGALKFREVTDAVVEALPAIGRREGFITYQATPTNAILDKAGRKALARLKRMYDGPTTLPVLDTPGQVALVDYFPGDTVTIDIPGALELEVDLSAVTLVETDGGEHDPILSFEEQPFDPILGDAIPKPGTGTIGGAGGGGGGGTGGGNGTSGGTGTSGTNGNTPQRDCTRTETFTEGDPVLILIEAYEAGSVTITLDAAPLTAEVDYGETDPATGVVTIMDDFGLMPGDLLTVTYRSAVCIASVDCGDCGGDCCESDGFTWTTIPGTGCVDTGEITGTWNAFGISTFPYTAMTPSVVGDVVHLSSPVALDDLYRGGADGLTTDGAYGILSGEFTLPDLDVVGGAVSSSAVTKIMLGSAFLQGFDVTQYADGVLDGPIVFVTPRDVSTPRLFEFTGASGGTFNYKYMMLPSAAGPPVGPDVTFVKVWKTSDPEPPWAFPCSGTNGTVADRIFGISVTVTADDTDGTPAAEYLFSRPSWCSDTGTAIAYYGQWTTPRFAATGDGTTQTFDLPVTPSGGVLAVMAWNNGLLEPCTFDAATRTFTLVTMPDSGDAIDVAWIPIP